jgi:hypothetical protein
MPALTLLDSAQLSLQRHAEFSGRIWANARAAPRHPGEPSARSCAASRARSTIRTSQRAIYRATDVTRDRPGANFRIGRDVLSLEIIHPWGRGDASSESAQHVGTGNT